jgi:hypothetical protein
MFTIDTPGVLGYGCEVIRREWFAPYRDGPGFRLTVWDTRRTIGGKHRLGYRLALIEPGTIAHLFEGEDFGAPPMYAIDSDQTVAALMGFLTLRPGDTDRDYFANYTPAQLDFCSQHAEALSAEVFARFGDD